MTAGPATTPPSSLIAARSDRSAVDRGEVPAASIPELVSALRQSVVAAAIECNTARLLIEQGDMDGLRECIDRLEARIVSADAKMTLAMNEAHRGV